MTQPLEQRISYHPSLGTQAGRGRGLRRVGKRLEAILQRVDVRSKTVLDLGCSGGYFCFRLSSMAARVVGIDGDLAVIERNREIVRRERYKNVSFEHGIISPEFLVTLPKFDVTLFLSVFHHMLAASDAYDWNPIAAQDHALATMAAIRSCSKVLVFEMGYPHEGYEWCERLPIMTPTPDDWIRRNVFGPEFPQIEVVRAPANQGMWGSLRRIGSHYTNGKRGVFARALRRALVIDYRDSRDIYIGRESGNKDGLDQQ
jgi:SAM-dependent methyltransferase